MQVVKTSIPDVLILEPKVFGDGRGFFFESFNQQNFQKLTGIKVNFVQDNHSKSANKVLRGLHYQIEHAQGKLVRVTAGEVFDVSVDVRRHSATFGKWVGVVLSSENKRQLWIPPGFAHGFLVMRDDTEYLYKTTDYYSPQHERCICWDDPAIGIEWPISQAPILSGKDQLGVALLEAEVFEAKLYE
jgi:dTDP-4-dehydrorhamnose 3,5-epimerase